MRIAFIGHKRIPSREGGVEVVVGQLAWRMAAKGHDVIAYNRRGRGGRRGTSNDCISAVAQSDCAESRKWRGVTIVSVPTLDKKGMAALSSSFSATLKAIRSRPDVVHYHAEGPCAMLPLARLFGLHTIATIHGLDWQRAKWGRFASAYLRFGERMAAKYADQVIVLSKNMQEYFRKRYTRETRLIPNGIDLPSGISSASPLPSDIIEEKYGLHNNDYILYVGRIVPEKGLHYLIEAFADIHTDMRLVIAGDSSDTDGYFRHVRELAAKDGRVMFVGHVEGHALEQLYSNCYVYVLPSDVEGMPMSLLEAMSHGCCCLTSDIPECVEVADGTSETFAHGDVESLRSGLERLFVDWTLVRRLSERSAVRAQRFGWDDVVDSTIDCYRSAVSSGAGKKGAADCRSREDVL